MKKNRYTYSLIVDENQIDTLNHVNNVHYIQWVQNAAQKHWDILSTTNLQDKYVWVVLRHEIDYMHPAELNDIINVSTWIGVSYGVKSERFVEFKKEAKIVAKAKTIWCLLDKKTMKPARIPSEIMLILQS